MSFNFSVCTVTAKVSQTPEIQNQPKIFQVKTKSKLAGKILQLDSDPNTNRLVLLGFGVLRLAQQKETEGAGIPGGCARRRQRAGPPLSQSSPPGKEDLEQGRRSGESLSSREGKGLRRETER